MTSCFEFLKKQAPQGGGGFGRRKLRVKKVGSSSHKNDPVNFVDLWGLSAEDVKAKLSKNNQIHIDKLHPAIRDKTIEMLSNLNENGINVEIVSSMRTIEEQNALYAIGRDKDGKKIEGEKIVTNAKGGTSNHNFGLAFDVEVYDDKGKKDWNDKGESWQAVIKEGEKQGFTSGSTFVNPKNDFPHFENMFGYSTSELKKLYDEGKTTGGFVNVN